LNNEIKLTIKFDDLKDNYLKAFVIKDNENYNLIFNFENKKTIFQNDEEICLIFNNIYDIFNTQYNKISFDINYIKFNNIKLYSEYSNKNYKCYLNDKKNCEKLYLDNLLIPIDEIHLNNINKDNVYLNSNIELPNINKIMKFIKNYNEFIFLNSDINEDILKEYINHFKQKNDIKNNKNLEILDFNFLGDYIRIREFIIFNNQIIGLNINTKLILCKETNINIIEKLLNEEIQNIKLNHNNPEILLSRIFVYKYNYNYAKTMLYHPHVIQNVLKKENKSYKLDNYINNLYKKNLYKLFIGQIVNYYNQQLTVVKLLKKMKKYKINNTTDNLKTTLDLFEFFDDDKLFKKITHNKKLFVIKNDINFKYKDTLFIQSCQNEGIYCENKKLLINNNDLENITKLFINDIKNPYRKKYILFYEYYDNLNSIFNYNSFLNEMIILS
jgi:hypothetical protein